MQADEQKQSDAKRATATEAENLSQLAPAQEGKTTAVTGDEADKLFLAQPELRQNVLKINLRKENSDAEAALVKLQKYIEIFDSVKDSYKETGQQFKLWGHPFTKEDLETAVTNINSIFEAPVTSPPSCST